MGSIVPVIAAPSAPKRPRRNTLETLRSSLRVALVLDVLLFLACLAGARVHRGAMQTIGRDSAPSIIHAQRIKTAMADMDANAANELLAPPDKGDDARKLYEQRRTEAAKALIDAAQNITYGKEERDPIERIQLRLGTYEAFVQRARDLHADKNAGAVAAYREAAKLLDTDLLPAADDLDRANFRHLDQTYSDQGGYSIAWRMVILFTGVCLLAALLWLQSFLSDRTRRILNPALLAATFITLAFTMWALTVFGSEERQLKIAKQDAFDSIHALWRARAVAYSANGDESRYLLDPANAAKAENHFAANVNLLARLPEGITWPELRDALYDNRPIRFTGYLADEFNNITFRGEREAAVGAIVRFSEYLRIDRAIRALEREGRHDQAVALCIGARPGESNYVFDQFDQALGNTMLINQTAFDAAVQSGFASLSNFEAKASIAAAIIGLLIFVGLVNRIAEYR